MQTRPTATRRGLNVEIAAFNLAVEETENTSSTAPEANQFSCPGVPPE